MMPSKFIAVVPKSVEAGDKICVRGTVSSDAQEFSINFANETCGSPENITYHFKWLCHENIIVEDFKQNGIWMDHKESQYNNIDGSQFALEFAFQDTAIYVYQIYDEGHSLVTTFEPEFDISDIQSVQVWGDVNKINELTFKYN